MPIAFPPFIRGPSYYKVPNLFRSQLDQVPAPNLARVGYLFTAEAKSQYGAAYWERWPNTRELGVMFRAPTNTSLPNPANTPAKEERVWDRVYASTGENMVLSGVSRDNSGATLGNCQVLVFRTSDKALVAETISDGSGNWSIRMMEAGAMFLVLYKAGGTPVAGTSLNTLKAVPVGHG